MTFLAKGRKEDLRILAQEMGEALSEDLKVIELRDMILKSKNFEEGFVKELLMTIIEDRKVKEEQEKTEKDRLYEQEKTEKDRAYELEKLKLELEASHFNSQQTEVLRVEGNQPQFEIKKLIPPFNPKADDMGLYLNLFERQLKFLKVPDIKWVAYLIGSLPNEVATLIARESEENAQNYEHVKKMLLSRFKLTAESFRQLFSQHRKVPEGTWRDFYFELRNYFEGWLAGLEIKNFDELKNLMIADQIKKRAPTDFKDHFLDDWAGMINPSILADKLDTYDNVRTQWKKDSTPVFKRRNCIPPKNDATRTSGQKWNTYPKKVDNPGHGTKLVERTVLRCYGCDAPGYIKSKCPTCSPVVVKATASFDNVQLHTCSETAGRPTVLNLSVNGIWGTACVDTGASHSIAGEILHRLLQDAGVKFKKTQLTISLANGYRSEEEVHTAQVVIELEGKLIETPIIALPKAKGNRTLLGADFLQKAGLVVNLKKRTWYFCDHPREKFKFVEEANLSTHRSPEGESGLNSCQLRENEGESLSARQRKELDSLLTSYERIFELGGEATPFMEHRIDTGNNPPVSVPPYRMSPVKKELLKKEVASLLEKKIIQECESPYAAPVVLVPKPNGTVRLCVDYRALNSITKTDTYPLPRMDDLLHEAKHTPFMSTIDLRSGYHQVNVSELDRSKTAFVCPFGTYCFTRMPFGLKNAPSSFQRLMDKFRSGLNNVFVLSYLDDLIVLSHTFEEHLSNLKAAFERLITFKLRVNRDKCNFACERVKYLGHWITNSGLEVDTEKTEAIRKMPPPRNVKQLQSFLQTCSWYRRFIPHFSEVARPLSNLTKKNAHWKWEGTEHKAFQTLKQLLVEPPVLKQSDATKPYIIRTDASNFALGAVLLQGLGPEEHPVEYASRLLTDAERNYSTTEREALAVVWALKKFRGYVEGQEITIASDHQPLRWLLSLKSPSGRLARWALQLQSYNLKMEYIPGKANVVADMLSRPVCQHVIGSCDLCAVTLDIPSRSPRDIREGQLKDDVLKEIIKSFESEAKDEAFVNWTSRGYIMTQGVLYRYVPDSDSEEAQLVVPTLERERVLKEYHDAPTAGHYGAEGTYNRLSSRYYWTGMRQFVANYVKNCNECNRYKPSNYKPAGLLQTPVYNRRFETLAIDLFGPLPESKNGKRWIFIIEDCATRWVELFALSKATARECATTLLEEIFLRYGLPRRIITDNGTQFVSAVMQQLCSLLAVDQVLTPVYHPQANPVERKNRDLKPRLAILVGEKHSSWEEMLPTIRFAMNTAKCETTGQTAAYLQFGRELRTVDDVVHDVRSIIQNDNFVPEITPYLKKFTTFLSQVNDRVEKRQDYRKQYADHKRRSAVQFKPGDRVWVTKHPLSNARKGMTSKFLPRRDGPYVVLKQQTPTTYQVSNIDEPELPIGLYHTSALRPCHDLEAQPLLPLRKRGRPKTPGSSSGLRRSQRGRM